jgi:hypothetical protein
MTQRLIDVGTPRAQQTENFRQIIGGRPEISQYCRKRPIIRAGENLPLSAGMRWQA